MIWPSLNTEPNAGMAPILPFLMRSMINSSLRSDFDSFGPLPTARPPSWWQKPQVVANICWPSMSFGEASACAGGLADPTEVDCSATAVGSDGQMMAMEETITKRIRIPASVLTGKGGKEKSLPPTPSSLSSQREDNQGAGILRHALVGLAKERDKLVGHQTAPARRYGDVLLATCHVADDAGIMAHAVVARPKLLAAFRIVGVHDTFGIRHEYQIARGGEDAGERRRLVVDLPLLGAADLIAGVKMTTGRPVRWRHQLERGAEVELGHRLEDRRGLLHRHIHAPLLADLVVEPGLRAIGAGVPADAAGDRRAQRTFRLAKVEVAATDQFPGFRIDVLDEVDVLDQLPDVLDLGVGAIIDEDEPALVGVHHELLVAAVDHDELAHRRVEVPGIVRQLLVVEFELAGIRIERDDRCGIEVRARPRSALLPVGARPVIKRCRVSGAPPHRIGLPVIGAGHPAAATAGPPGVIAPRRHGLFGAGDR